MSDVPHHSLPAESTLHPDQGEQHDVVELHALTREKPEPQEGFEPVSLWVVALTGVLLFWGGYYLANFNGRFEANEYSEFPHGQATAIAAPETPEQKLARIGAQVYNGTCAACHMADGAGNPGLNIPPLAGSDWVLTNGPNRMIRIVLSGITGPIKVNGQVYQGNAMNPWRKTAENPSGLTDEEISAVLTYTRNSWGNKASMVTADEVKVISEATKARTDPWTEAELLAIPVSGGAAPTAPSIAGSTNAPFDLSALKAHLQQLPPDQLKALLEAVQPK